MTISRADVYHEASGGFDAIKAPEVPTDPLTGYFAATRLFGDSPFDVTNACKPANLP